MRIEIDDETLAHGSESAIAEIAREQFLSNLYFKPKSGTFIQHWRSGRVWFVRGNDFIPITPGQTGQADFHKSYEITHLDGGHGRSDGSLPKSKWTNVTATFTVDTVPKM